MAQHIWILIEDSEGRKKNLEYNFADIFNLKDGEEEFKYINKIDPYSDTVFLRTDIKYLLCDLRALDKKHNFKSFEILIEEFEMSDKIIFIWD